MLKIGFSCGEEYLKNEQFFADCKAAGIRCLEVSLPKRTIEKFDFMAAAKLAEKHGIELWSAHLPFAPFDKLDPSSLDERRRRFTVKRDSEVIRRAGEAGIRHFVIHASAEPIAIEDRRARMEQAKKSLRELADVAESVGGVVCVEDLPRTCLGRSSYDILELLKADERLRCCFDTNHLLGEYITNFIKNVGSKIVTTHISDYDFWNERHVMPGEGLIDWKELYDALVAEGYNGPWLYETGLRPEWCIVRERDLTPADIANNAREIFEGKKPTPFGHFIDNMPFWRP